MCVRWSDCAFSATAGVWAAPAETGGGVDGGEGEETAMRAKAGGTAADWPTMKAEEEEEEEAAAGGNGDRKEDAGARARL